ncbi:unnamed protein product, partial [Staurois parvus]
MQHCTHMKFVSFFCDRWSFILVVFNHLGDFYFFLNKPKTTENFEKSFFLVFVIKFCKS